MTGPEHYREAERLEQLAAHQYAGSDTTDPHPQWTLTIQQAQVHATLALAAGTVETAYAVATHGEDGAIRTDWIEAVA